MRRQRMAGGPLLLAAALLGLSTGAAAAAPGGTIEGRWLLVEQSYGEGGTDLASGADPVRLEFAREGAGHAGRLGRPDQPAAAWSWPAWEASGRLLPVRILERSEAPGGTAILVRYTVQPAEGDATLLEIVESYAVDPATGDLAGTVKVTFLTEEGPKGGYTLRRRFERER